MATNYGDKLICVLFLGAYQIFFVGAAPFIAKVVLDLIFEDRRLVGITPLILFFLLFNLGSFLFDFLNGYLKAYVNIAFRIDLSNRFIRKAIHYPMDKVSQKNTGELMFRNSADVMESSRLMVDLLLNVPLWIGKLTIICIIISRWSYLFLLAVPVFLPLFVLFAHQFGRRLYKINTNCQQKKQDLFAYLQDVYSHMKLHRTHRSENTYLKKYHRFVADFGRLHIRLIAIQNFAAMISSTLYICLLAIFVLILVYASDFGNASFGSMIAVTMYLAWLLRLFAEGGQLYTEKFGKLASATRLKEFLEQEGAINRSRHSKCNRPSTSSNSYILELANIHFEYPGEQLVFSNLSCTIKKGEIVAIIGKNGVGKTTLLNLIAGVYTPQSGSVLYYGENIVSLDASVFRRSFGVITQGNSLINDTIKENIVLGKKNYSQENLQFAIEYSGVCGFINNLPQGINTCVGENGSILSCGQQQRIAIARALLYDPSVLLLDEPFAGQDLHSQASIMDTLLRLHTQGKTLVVSSHDLRPLQSFDYFLLVQDHGVRKIMNDGNDDMVLAEVNLRGTCGI
ncbi:MAG: ABC transporter ATP-binding protein [Planctomycetota bacterium]